MPIPTAKRLQIEDLIASGNHVEALDAIRKFLRVHPKNIEAQNFAVACAIGMQDWGTAEKHLIEIIRIRPDYPEAHSNLGAILIRMERPREAEKALRRAIALRPGFIDAFSNLANMFAMMGRLGESENVYRQALEAAPRHPDLLSGLGGLLAQAKKYEDAEDCYRRALSIQPENVETRYSLADLLAASGQYGEAEALYRELIREAPAFWKAYNNLGNLLEQQDRLHEAHEVLERGLAIAPDTPELYNNLGAVLIQQMRLMDAKAAVERALALRQDFVPARWNLAFVLLHLGEFTGGWSLFETRHEPTLGIVHMPPVDFPHWMGEDLRGKSIAVWNEQGLGDDLQFVRFVPALKAMGARHVTLVAKPRTQTLFAMIEGIDAILPDTDPAAVPQHDYWVLLMSLPHRLGVHPEQSVQRLPYLRPPIMAIERWQQRFPMGLLRIGLVWRSSPRHRTYRIKSLSSLALLKPLWSISGIEFVSLQREPDYPEGLEFPADQPILRPGDFEDFTDTAGAIAQLDLVITVDTAIAHLVAAMGKPCWMLLPIPCEWRWMTGRDDSPWYPGVMRLFRQTTAGDWSDVIARVRTELAVLAASSGTRKGSVTSHHAITETIDSLGEP